MLLQKKVDQVVRSSLMTRWYTCWKTDPRFLGEERGGKDGRVQEPLQEGTSDLYRRLTEGIQGHHGHTLDSPSSGGEAAVAVWVEAEERSHTVNAAQQHGQQPPLYRHLQPETHGRGQRWSLFRNNGSWLHPFKNIRSSSDCFFLPPSQNGRHLCSLVRSSQSFSPLVPILRFWEIRVWTWKSRC